MEDESDSASSEEKRKPRHRRTTTYESMVHEHSRAADMEDEALDETLVKLHAAEWHVLHRAQNLDKNTLQHTLSERRSSIEKEMSLFARQRRLRRAVVLNTDDIQAVLHETTKRKRVNTTTKRVKTLEPNKRVRKRTLSKIHTHIQPSTSLSALLTRELLRGTDPSIQSRTHTFSSGDLIAKVSKVEEKKRQVRYRLHGFDTLCLTDAMFMDNADIADS